VRYLFNHNPDAVLARTKSGTLKLGEDKAGLAVDAELAPTSVGRDLAILMERGDVNQMSIGFRVIQDEWEEVEGDDGHVYERRTIKEAQLFDVSAVTYPAYEETDAGLRTAEHAREVRDARGVHVTKRSQEPAEPSTDTQPAPEPPAIPSQGETPETPPSSPEPVTTTPAESGAPTPTTQVRSTGAVSLYEDRARIWNKMKSFRTETDGRVLSATEEEEWQRMERDIDRVGASIEIAERGAKLAEILEGPGAAPVSTRSAEPFHPATPSGAAGSPADNALRGGSTVNGGVPGDIQMRYDYEKAFGTYLRRGFDRLHEEERALLEREFRDLSVGTNTAGGYTVPPGFAQRITDAMKAFGGMLQVANIIDTAEGNTLVWPTADDTGNTGAILAENTAAPTQDITFGQKTIGAFMYTSKMVKVSFQLLNDSAFGLEPWLSDKFADRLGRALNAHFTNGTGGGTQPVGMVPNLAVGKTGQTGQTLTATYDDLIDLIHSIDPAYRSGATGFMMNDNSVKVFRKLKDTTGQYLWQPSLQAGVPDRLAGYNLYLNQDMPVMAANAKSIAFGDFNKAYIIRRVQGIQSLRLNERYADALQVGFLAFARYDGTVDDLNAAKLYVNSAT
jgi:HK97 family phage major capsid protein/HK97 family phage prohead protease